MSPEQVEAKDIDQRSDIYSLGIILYEMLTGRAPFEADSPFAVGIKQKSEKPKDPREINPQITADLSDVILKCLEKAKQDRYQTAAHLKFELERIEQGLPKSDCLPAKRKPLTSREITVKVSLKKIALPGMALLALAAAAILLLVLIPKKKAPVGPKRVAIARALVHDPALLLADEPTGNLDDENGKLILGLLDRLTRRAGKNMIMVTHNIEAAAIANRILTMREGQLVSNQDRFFISNGLIRVGRRYPFGHAWQTILMVLGIALGVAVIVAVDIANASAIRLTAISRLARASIADNIRLQQYH